ncbi:hypothetical protein TL16_g05703 [Triparma laevis f. inornata]|uniref:MaoC-like domain-containing protein n=1 Tax=Triparma laevis f. inornata TaxID=1714386 RepID=A0A9W7AKL4_9STRA|nr:hypothetical protein TL16_g05703 [Triparma laevis f. inornata]
MSQALFNIAIIALSLTSVLLTVLFIITTIISVPLTALFRSLFFRRPGAIAKPVACGSGAKIEDATRIAGRDSIVDASKSRAWAQFCGFRGTTSISPVYSFPMLMEELFTKIVFTDSFPLSLIGVIHAKHVITQYAVMPEAFSYSLAVTAVREVETGAECDVSMEIFNATDGKIANRTVCTFTSTDALKAKRARKNRPELTKAEKKAKTALNPIKENNSNSFTNVIKKDHSLKYAKVSGDSNPIHHPTYCKLMGMSKPIMHGIYSLAVGVAKVFESYDLEGVYPVKIQCGWKLPLPIPKESTFEYGELKGNVGVDFENDKTYSRNVEFVCFREGKGGSKLPHLRGVVSFDSKF